MIKSEILHPQLLAALAKAGHKARILFSDANYSFVTNSSPRAEIVYLNLAPGTVPSPEILARVTRLINVEQATTMAWPDDFENTIHKEYVDILPDDTPMDLVARADVYAAAKSPDTLLVIASGETRRFANIILTVGPVIVQAAHKKAPAGSLRRGLFFAWRTGLSAPRRRPVWACAKPPAGRR